MSNDKEKAARKFVIASIALAGAAIGGLFYLANLKGDEAYIELNSKPRIPGERIYGEAKNLVIKKGMPVYFYYAGEDMDGIKKVRICLDEKVIKEINLEQQYQTMKKYLDSFNGMCNGYKYDTSNLAPGEHAWTCEIEDIKGDKTKDSAKLILSE